MQLELKYYRTELLIQSKVPNHNTLYSGSWLLWSETKIQDLYMLLLCCYVSVLLSILAPLFISKWLYLFPVMFFTYTTDIFFFFPLQDSHCSRYKLRGWINRWHWKNLQILSTNCKINTYTVYAYTLSLPIEIPGSLSLSLSPSSLKKIWAHIISNGRHITGRDTLSKYKIYHDCNWLQHMTPN